MTYFAKVENGIVTDVIVADQSFIDTLPNSNQWIETSVSAYGNQYRDPETGIIDPSNNSPVLRGNYAGIGYTYNSTHDVFYAPRPYASWILNESTWLWESPVPYPNDGKSYVWNEETQNWIEG